ncbi:MAG: hypothetical protein WBA54_04885 [Acidaminobacteraceae bacterium]
MKETKFEFMGHGFNLIKVINRILGDEFEPSFSENTVIFYHTSGRAILRLVDSPTVLEVEFMISVPTIPGVVELTKEEMKEHHRDSHWLYKGKNIEDIVMLTEFAIQNFIKHYH